MPKKRNWRKSEAQASVMQGRQERAKAVETGVIDKSDGGLAHPSYLSSSTDEGPSEHLNEIENETCYEIENETCYEIENETCYQIENKTLKKTENQTWNLNENLTCNETENEIATYSDIFTEAATFTELDTHRTTCSYSLTKKFNSRLLILGSFNQADKRFSEESRGSQCCANALCALVYTKYSTLCTTQDIDSVLVDGDKLYNTILLHLKAKRSFKSRMLNFDEIPDTISLLNGNIIVEKSEVISGVCTQLFSTSYLPSLNQSLHFAFQKSSYILIMIGSICSAVFKKDNEYYFFDSHSHAADGLSSPDGKSVLLSFYNIEDLVSFLYALYDSMQIDISAQFDLLPVNLCQPAEGFVRAAEITKDAAEVNVTTVTNHYNNGDTMQNATVHRWKAVSYKKRGKIKSCSLDKSDIQPKCKVVHTDGDRTANLIGRYFQDQERKTECKHAKAKTETNRKLYQKLYKQKQRQSDDFKSKEREVKRNARASAEYRLRETAKEKEAKRTARESDEFRSKEKAKEREIKSRARESREFRSKEKAKERETKRTARESHEFRLKERETKKTARKSNEFRSKEKAKERETKRTARESQETRLKEREIKRTARESHEFRSKERAKERETKRTARESHEFRSKERAKERETKRTARTSNEFRSKEKAKEKETKRTVRESNEYSTFEKAREKASKRRKRLVEKYRQWEAERKRSKRESYEYKQKELDTQRKSKRKARSDPYVLERERVLKQQQRYDAQTKMKENIIDRKRKALKRENPSFRENERLDAKLRKSSYDISSCTKLFHKSLSVGPVYICSCCHQTWFRQSVSEAKSLSSEQKVKYLTNTISVDNKEWVCTTCKASIFGGKVPKLSVLNGMKWPIKPKELDLFSLEERLIALRIPFMQMRELPRGRQLSVKGNVINVPVDIQPVVNALPRPFDENITVAVKLKKKMSFKSCAFSENVRPLRVLVALHWLMKNSDMYKNANVNIDEAWIKNVTENSNEILSEFISSETAVSTKVSSAENQYQKHVQGELLSETKEHDSTVSGSTEPVVEELYDSDAEEVAQENVGNVDTLIDDANLENRNSTFTFAPGEGQRPISIYQDKDSEYLCFPSIFCGQRRKENEERQVPVNYSDIAKWELRCEDRRAANSIPNIFFKMKKMQMKQLNDKVNLAMRRYQTDKNTLTAEQVRNSDAMANMVKSDEAYYIFKQLRNSPAYLETRKKDVFAMIRQLGLPTWFLSLSSADTRWNDLLKMLASLNEKVNYTDDEIENLTWEQKIKLIQSDPVTCSRYFDHRVQQFINLILTSEHKPLGKVTDYFYRVEFQQRGSPHIHMIVWIENAPKFDVHTDEEIAAYVDQYLQCRIEDQDLGYLTDLQVHKHSRTCRKKQDRICRFGYPLPPLSETMVLNPLETDKDKYYKLYQKLQKKMNEEKEGFKMTYEQFLKSIVQMSEADYIKCIRSSLKTAKVFLKRDPNEIRVNLYNKSVLKAWQANIDIQFVLDPYACAMYIVSYISKSQRGMSNLLHAAAKEARNGNLDIRRQVRHIGNVFSNSVEVSAQEAVYLVLQMPLTKSTRDVVFINTSPASKRVQLLKPNSVLENLPGHSTDIVADNVIKRYSRRPKALEKYCLADYVSQLDVIYPDSESISSDKERNDDENNFENSDEECFDETSVILTLKNGIKIRRRRNFKIIRYVRFSHRSDEENHYREKLLLFYPWRSEDTDLLGNFNTYKDHYESMKHFLDHKCSTYEHHVDELELGRELAEGDLESEYDVIAPGAQQMEADTAEEKSVESETFIYFNPDRVVEHREYDIAIEIGCSTSTSQLNPIDNILSDENYRELLRCLNSKQKQFYNHVIHWMKTKDVPLYAFLCGGAGVGKSVVIRALYQTLYRQLNLKEGENADDIRVLLCAYTGKAAFNIKGSTISSAFFQKYKQSDQTLNCDNLNTFRSKYRNLSVVIIDEISMVGNTMLNFIDQRLQELKGTKQRFGGVSIIAVGDLYQLRPISGSWIFNDMTEDATALSINLWKDHFTMFELTEVMRQKDDLEFAKLLNRLRKNVLTDEDKTTLHKCKTTPTSPGYSLHAPHLFAENYFMRSFNDSIIDSMNTEKVSIPCYDSVSSPKLSKEKQAEAIKRLPTDPQKTANLHCSLTIVVGMIYDLTVNTNTEDGLANGASCVVKLVEYKQKETTRPSVVWVQFDDRNVGIETREKFKARGFYHKNIDNDWTPIFDIERSFVYNRKTFQRIQFPLQPSAGRTVHRAQGSTLDKVVIDLSQKKTRKIPHLHYVALSRVRSMENLQILNFNEGALTVDDQVKTEMERLNRSAMLELCYKPLESVDSRFHFKMAFNNCRSLHLHFEDIKSDQNLLSSHLFGIAESRLRHTDHNSGYSIDGYTLFRNDQTATDITNRPPHGLVVYVKDGSVVTSQLSFSSKKFEFTKMTIVNSLNEIQYVALYKAPGMSDRELTVALDRELFPVLDVSKPLVIMGDFNINALGKQGPLVQKICEKFSCTMQIKEPTTDSQSALDLVFSNISGVTGTVETYWSDHKIVYFYS